MANDPSLMMFYQLFEKNLKESLQMIDMNKKYRYENGDPAYVLTTERCNHDLEKPYIPPVVSMDLAGNIHLHNDKGQWESDESEFNLVEVGQYDHLKKDDKVIAYFAPNASTCDHNRRYFSHVDAEGVPYVFIAGSTSWSTCQVSQSTIACHSVEKVGE